MFAVGGSYKNQISSAVRCQISHSANDILAKLQCSIREATANLLLDKSWSNANFEIIR